MTSPPSSPPVVPYYWDVTGHYSPFPEFSGAAPIVIYSAADEPLPTATDDLRGVVLMVSDASSPTYLGAYTSGGDTLVTVLCLGASGGWVTT